PIEFAHGGAGRVREGVHPLGAGKGGRQPHDRIKDPGALSKSALGEMQTLRHPLRERRARRRRSEIELYRYEEPQEATGAERLSPLLLSEGVDGGLAATCDGSHVLSMQSRDAMARRSVRRSV